MSRTKRDILDTETLLSRLEDLLHKHVAGDSGYCRADAEQLRRISMTLHRWHEMECGTANGAVERDETTGKTYWRPTTGDSEFRKSRWLIADREKGALARLARVMARYPSLSFYVQGDPRGADLYILRPGDVPAGESADAYYSRGLAVHQ